MIERGEKISELADKSADMNNAATNFLEMAKYVVFVCRVVLCLQR